MSNSILFFVKPLPLIASIKRIKLLNSITMTVLLSLLAACSGSLVTRPSKEIHATMPTSKQSTSPTPIAQLPIGAENSSKTLPANKNPTESANTAIINPGNNNSITVLKPGAGGYYLDDGPGENAPANIGSIPNAPLKMEKPYLRANKPYFALGQNYTPMTRYSSYKKQGIASWYGKRFHGKKTSTGEVYDMYAMSGAHTILPLPSYVKVTNPINQRFVVVRLNDRGPFKRSRLIDLSYAAAFKLGLVAQGSGLVEVEAIDTSTEAMLQINNETLLTAINVPTLIDNAMSANARSGAADGAAGIAEDASLTKQPIILPNSTSENTLHAGASQSPNVSYPNGLHYVQAGAFKLAVNGEILQKRIQDLALAENVGVASVYNNGLYRVKLGPYSNRNEADTSAANIRKQLNTAAIVTNQ